jgi:hypothetical protein
LDGNERPDTVSSGGTASYFLIFENKNGIATLMSFCYPCLITHSLSLSITLSLSLSHTHTLSLIAQSDYSGVASALIRMGATTGTVDEVKFGKELKIVFDKVSAMAPDIIVSSTLDGELIYVSCAYMNQSGRRQQYCLRA